MNRLEDDIKKANGTNDITLSKSPTWAINEDDMLESFQLEFYKWAKDQKNVIRAPIIDSMGASCPRGGFHAPDSIGGTWFCKKCDYNLE